MIEINLDLDELDAIHLSIFGLMRSLYRSGTVLLWDKHTKDGGIRHSVEIEFELKKLFKIYIDKCLTDC